MNKKTVDKYKQVRRKDEQPEISAAEHRANCNEAVSLIMNVVERLPKDAPPVTESMDDLMMQLKTGVKQQPVTVLDAAGRRIKYHDGTAEILDSSAIADDLNDISGENVLQVAPDALQPPKLASETTGIASLVREKRYRSIK